MSNTNESGKLSTGAYHHRTAFGCWINDMRNEAMPHENWPYVVLDEQAERDIIGCLDLQRKVGFNEFDVFGLLISHDWPLDIHSAVDADRRRRVRRVLKAAHDRGIKVIYGLGVYSWGFDVIIKNTPAVQGPNPSAMCGSKPESWRWMQKVVDYILSEFEVDGFHLEASDQGRCSCPSCSKQGDVEYYSRLNGQTAEYIRGKRPDKILMVNMCGYLPGGCHVAEEEMQYLINMSRHLDYLIDPGHRGHFVHETARRDLIRNLHCDYGTSGGIWIYPPQPWERFRWFLPHTTGTWRHIQQLYGDGGRAMEYYMGPIINPGVEVNVAFGGKLLMNSRRSHEEVLTEVLEMLYKPRNSEAMSKLVRLFTKAEEAYFSQWMIERILEAEKGPIGELHLVSLWKWKSGDSPKPAAYLMAPYLDATGRLTYKKELSLMLDDILEFEDLIGDKVRVDRIKKCMRSTIKDIEDIG